jgi:hypothetical protein
MILVVFELLLDASSYQIIFFPKIGKRGIAAVFGGKIFLDKNGKK